MTCAAHILNLIVSDSLKDVNKSIELIRLAVKYVKSSLSSKCKFTTICVLKEDFTYLTVIELKERREKEERNLEHRICGSRLRDCKHRYFHSSSHNGLQSVFYRL